MWNALHGIVDKLSLVVGSDFVAGSNMPKWMNNYITKFTPRKRANKLPIGDFVWSRKRDGWFIVIYVGINRDIDWQTRGNNKSPKVQSVVENYIEYLKTIGFQGFMICEYVMTDQNDVDYLHEVGKSDNGLSTKLIITDYVKLNAPSKYVERLAIAAKDLVHSEQGLYSVEVVEHGTSSPEFFTIDHIIEKIKSSPWEGIVIRHGQTVEKVKIEYFRGRGRGFTVNLIAVLLDDKVPTSFCIGYKYNKRWFVTNVIEFEMEHSELKIDQPRKNSYDGSWNDQCSSNWKHEARMKLLNSIKRQMDIRHYTSKPVDMERFVFSASVWKIIGSKFSEWLDVTNLELNIQGAANSVYRGATTFHLQACIVYQELGESKYAWTAEDWEHYTNILEFNNSVLGQPTTRKRKLEEVARSGVVAKKPLLVPALQWNNMKWILQYNNDFPFCINIMGKAVPIVTFFFSEDEVVLTSEQSMTLLDLVSPGDQSVIIKKEVPKHHTQHYEFNETASFQFLGIDFRFTFDKCSADTPSVSTQDPINNVFFSIEASSRPAGLLWSPGPAHRS